MRLTHFLLMSTLPLAFSAPALEAQTIVGRVLDRSTESPVEGASVSLDGTSVQALTDSLGRFLLRPVEPGVYVLEVQHLAYGVRRDSLRVAEGGGALTVTVRLAERAIALEPMDVTVLSEAERRRRSVGAAGYMYITREELDTYELRGANNVPDVLRMHKGNAVRVRPYMFRNQQFGQCLEASRAVTRPSLVGADNPFGCRLVAIVIDGVLIPPPQSSVGGTPLIELTALLDDIGPWEIEKIEFLPPTEAIFRYGLLGADGAVVIETRRGRALAASSAGLATEEQLYDRAGLSPHRHWKYPAAGAVVGLVASLLTIAVFADDLPAACMNATCDGDWRYRARPWIALGGTMLGAFTGEIAFRIGVGGARRE